MKILVKIINLPGTGAINESFKFYEGWDLLIRIAQKNFLPYQKIPSATISGARGNKLTGRILIICESCICKIIGKHREEITTKMILKTHHKKEQFTKNLNEHIFKHTIRKKYYDEKRRNICLVDSR